jgi:hypothetical protein
MNAPTRLTASEVARLTDQAAHLFIARHVNDYWPCNLNSNKMMNFIESQLGENYPYPFTLEHFEAAFAYLNQHDFLLPRPVEVEDNSAQIAEQQRALEAANTNLAACKAEEIRIAKRMPLKELGQFTSVENAKLREARDRGESSDRPVGQSSRPVSTITLGVKAQARNNVALALPEITDRNGPEFSRLYAAELARLRG